MRGLHVVRVSGPGPGKNIHGTQNQRSDDVHRLLDVPLCGE